MARKYTRPEKYDADGLPIYYTSSDITTRGKKITRVKMSYRQPKEKKTICNGQPEYGPILYTQDHQVPDDLKAERDPVLATVVRFSRSFYSGLLKELSVKAKRNGKLQIHQNIPFAVACGVWFEDNTRRKETLAAYETAYETICQDKTMRQWLTMPSGEITPSLCKKTLGQLPVPTHKKIVALIRAVMEQEVQARRLTDSMGNVCAENPWENIRIRRPRPNRTSLNNIYRYVRPKVLEPSQVQEVLSYCREQIEKKSSIESTVLCLLSLFVCCLGLPVEELLYMRICDIIPQTETTPLCVVVLGKIGRNKYDRGIPFDRKLAHKRRILPLPDVIADSLKAAGVLPTAGSFPYLQDFEKAVSSNLKVRDMQPYLFSSPQNRMRHMEGNEAIKKINLLFEKVVRDNRFLDGEGRPFKSSKSFTAYARMLITAENALRRVGMEEDELRYILGLAPNTVAAESYCDFSHERELYRLYSLLNLSLCKTRGEVVPGGESRLSNGAIREVLSIPDEVIHAEMTAEYVRPSEEQLRPFVAPAETIPWLRITAEYGFNISAQYRGVI